MKKKLSILAIIIIIIGIIIVAIKGFNVNLENKAHQSISIPIGKEFNISDIKEISKEVFGKQIVQITKASAYQDTAIINVESASQEQLDQLKNKIEEKYNLKAEDKNVNKEETTDNSEAEEQEKEEDTKETTTEASNKFELTVTKVPRIRLFDMAKQYILFLSISTVIVLVYFAIRFKKLNALKVLSKSVIILLISELFYMAIIAITRYPIDHIAIIVFIAIYITVLTYLNNVYINEASKK